MDKSQAEIKHALQELAFEAAGHNQGPGFDEHSLRAFVGFSMKRTKENLSSNVTKTATSRYVFSQDISALAMFM